MSEAPEPARFPPELLAHPVGVRQAYFEQQVLINHPRLVEVVRQTISAVCFAEAPGPPESSMRPDVPDADRAPASASRVSNEDSASASVSDSNEPWQRPVSASERRENMVFRDPLMVLVIGASRVGKTTSVSLMVQELAGRMYSIMAADPNIIPVVSVNARGSNKGSFDWSEWYKSILRAEHDPFLAIAARNRAFDRERDYEAAMVEALKARHTRVILVDEAHNLAQARTGSALDSHLRYLKGIEQAAHVSHIFVGTYAMRPFRTVDEQVSLRTRDVHFARYDARKAEDKDAFASTLWAFQLQLPLRATPPLVERYWEYLYERSLGCIGLLKTHLNRALELAIQEDADTITETHLRKAEMPADKLARAYLAIEIGEREMSNAESVSEAIERLKRELSPDGVSVPGRVQVATREAPTPTPSPKSNDKAKRSGRALPGDRRPGRDGLGPGTTAGHGSEAAG